MKTIQELYNEVMGSQELKAQFIESTKAGKLIDFLKAHGCEATLEEVKAFLKAKSEEDAPLSLNELDNAAGGACSSKIDGEVRLSIFTVGIGCAAKAISSAINGHVGARNEHEGNICNDGR